MPQAGYFYTHTMRPTLVLLVELLLPLCEALGDVAVGHVAHPVLLVRDDVAAEGEREGRVHVRDVQHHPNSHTPPHHHQIRRESNLRPAHMLAVDRCFMHVVCVLPVCGGVCAPVAVGRMGIARVLFTHTNTTQRIRQDSTHMAAP